MAGQRALSRTLAAGDDAVTVDHAASYVHAGFILISVPNLALIGSMIALFVIALLAPFPAGRRPSGRGSGHE